MLMMIYHSIYGWPSILPWWPQERSLPLPGFVHQNARTWFFHILVLCILVHVDSVSWHLRSGICCCLISRTLAWIM